MQYEQAAQTLARLEEIQSRTRIKLRDFWFPLVAFGALMVVSVPFIAAFGGAILGPYWLLAGPLGGAAVSRYYRSQATRVGLEGPCLPYAFVGIGIFAGCILTGALGGALDVQVLAVAGPPLVIATGLLTFAWLDRSAGESLLALALAALTLLLLASDMTLEQVSIVGTLVYGVAWLATGLFYRRLQR